jgi:hypothetical protein
LVLVLAVGGAAAASIGAADGEMPAFVVDDAMQFTFPIAGAPKEGLSILVASKTGTLTRVKVQVREFRDPDGRNRDPAILKAPDAIGDVTPDGMRFTLMPEPASFHLAGDYRVTLSLEGTAAGQKDPVRTLVKFIIRRPAPELNLDDVKDQTITLTRCCPWSFASGTGVIPLHETSGKGAVSDVVVTGRPLLRTEDRAQVPGNVKAEIADKTIAAGGDGPVTLKFADVAWAGKFVTQVAVASPSFPTGKSVSLNVVVRDTWIWPLLFIALGVFGGFVAQYAAQTVRPRRENTYQITRLRAEVRRYQGLVRKGSKIAVLAGLSDRLRAAEEQNNFGTASKAKPLIDQAVQDLAAFIKGEDADRTKVETDFKTLKAQIHKYRDQRGHAALPEEITFFTTSEGTLQEVDDAFLEGQLDLAAEILDDLSQSFAGIKRLQLQKSLEALGNRIAALAVEKDRKEQKKELLKKYLTACQQLGGGKEDEARGTAMEVETDLKILEADTRARAARGDEKELPDVVFTLAAAEPPPPVTQLTGTDPVEKRTTDTALGFEIVDDGRRLQAGDKILWHFGDGGSFAPGGQKVNHSFGEPGPYRVKAQVRRGDVVVLELAVDVFVLPGKVQRKLDRLGAGIQRIDTMLSLVALVLACLTGLLYLYAGKPFGTINDYLLAILWGFGIDNTVRGFAPVLAKITGSGSAAGS